MDGDLAAEMPEVKVPLPLDDPNPRHPLTGNDFRVHTAGVKHRVSAPCQLAIDHGQKIAVKYRPRTTRWNTRHIRVLPTHAQAATWTRCSRRSFRVSSSRRATSRRSPRDAASDAVDAARSTATSAAKREARRTREPSNHTRYATSASGVAFDVGAPTQLQMMILEVPGVCALHRNRTWRSYPVAQVDACAAGTVSEFVCGVGGVGPLWSVSERFCTGVFALSSGESRCLGTGRGRTCFDSRNGFTILLSRWKEGIVFPRLPEMVNPQETSAASDTRHQSEELRSSPCALSTPSKRETLPRQLSEHQTEKFPKSARNFGRVRSSLRRRRLTCATPRAVIVVFPTFSHNYHVFLFNQRTILGPQLCSHKSCRASCHKKKTRTVA